ncbi:YsnF/AvaK domain-containing protein [Anaeromyxobacter oryzae]|uniref:DUF2382 domain-containing protein n=1 Tax=Anaeromyxobacter oryzae TaxID=2918170 RepID=A0ABM7WYZ7_9BACT|nr:YsnF/AvaK domain-containing protein [Anaeromyxobacter oryzae]BDG04714.1 hypothetical protein AMOR_37100 [Anaeromyxobacter oryzae]
MENRGVQQGVQQGMAVRSSDGEKLGKVVQCSESFFLVEKGFFFPKDYLARYEQVADVRDGEVHLSAAASALREAGDEAFEAGQTGSTADNLTARTEGNERLPGSREEVRVPLAEEELTAETKMRDAGEVRVRKDVVTEHRQIEVPVTRDEVHVERVPASGSAEVGPQSFQEKTVSVPIREEEVEIRKKPVVREEIRVTKTRRQEERRADADVRREEARIEGEGEVDRTSERRDSGLGEPPKE